MKSIWQKEIKKPEFMPLAGDIKTDVLIIGGGITGILCGYMLKNAGIDSVIAEAKDICGGVTKNTTAKITCHHGAIFDKMIRRYGLEAAELYLRAHQRAVEKYRELAQKIDCDFKDSVSFVYSLTDRKKIEKEVKALNKLKASAVFTNKLPLPVSAVGAVEMKNQAEFHPLKFAYSLAKELKIFENTEILELKEGCAITERGKIRAKKIIVATHFPFINKHGFYFLKLYQHRSYVLALKNTPSLGGIYIDESEKGLSFRGYGDLLLLGGGSHRTGKKGGGWQELSDFAAKNYPNAEEVCRFATQDCKSLDDIAYIGRYSERTPSLYVATGFNKWGMTSSMVAANILTDLIMGKENEYSHIFSPSRGIWHPQLFANIGETTLGLLRPTAPRCSHLGCALKYNKQEHSWDCACHGSRFNEEGRLIDNPATKDIKPK